MIPTKTEKRIIKRRIEALDKAHINRMCFLPPYHQLPEEDKISWRIDMAEISTLKSLLLGEDLDKLLEERVRTGQYCGAEGAKRVKYWMNSKG